MLDYLVTFYVKKKVMLLFLNYRNCITNVTVFVNDLMFFFFYICVLLNSRCQMCISKRQNIILICEMFGKRLSCSDDKTTVYWFPQHLQKK